MIALQRNRQKMKYVIPTGKTPEYKRDENGDIIYDIDEETGEEYPVETGEYVNTYSDVVGFGGCINSQLEDAITRAWGSDNSNNFAVLVLSKSAKDDNGNLIDFPNGTLIWRKNLPAEGEIDYSTAEYTVDGVMDEELNETSYYLRKRK